MKSERGSITIISLAMLLFLLVVAVAWLPMMTAEKNAAASDYKEQQAWYAAEAGYNKALVALKNKETITTGWLTGLQDMKDNKFLHNSLTGEKVEQDKVWYAVSITEIIDGIETDITEVNDNTQYTVTAVGSCNGVRKVIRKAYTVGDTGNNGGSDEGEIPVVPPQNGIYKGDSLVTAGGNVEINNVNDNASADIYYGGSFNVDGKPDDKYPQHKKHQGTPTGVKYGVDSKIFEPNYYKKNKFEEEILTDSNKILSGVICYQGAILNNESINKNITVKGNSVLLTKGDIYLRDLIINVQSGVLQIISNGKVIMENITVTGGGQLTVIANSNLTINTLSGSSKILLIGSDIVFDDPNVQQCFMSASGNIVLQTSGTDSKKIIEYWGQMQAGGQVVIRNIYGKKNDFKLRFLKSIGESIQFPLMK